MKRFLLIVMICLTAPRSLFAAAAADLPAAVDLPADKIKRSYLGAIQFALTADGKFAYAIHGNGYGIDHKAKPIDDASVIKIDLATLEIVAASPRGKVEDRIPSVTVSKAGLIGRSSQMKVLDPETFALLRKVDCDKQLFKFWSSPASDIVLASLGGPEHVALINARWGEVEAMIEVRHVKRGPKFIGYDGYIQASISEESFMSADGSTLYTSAYDSIMKFSFHEKSLTLDAVSPPAGGGKIALSPDGKRIAIAGIFPSEDAPGRTNRQKFVAALRTFGKRERGDTYVYDAANLKKPIVTLKGGKLNTTIVVGNDFFIQISDADTMLVYDGAGKIVGNFNLPAKVDPHKRGIEFYAFPDGRTLLAIGEQEWLIDLPAMNLTKKGAKP